MTERWPTLWAALAAGFTGVVLLFGGAWSPPAATLTGTAIAILGGAALLRVYRLRWEEWLLAAVLLAGALAVAVHPLAPLDSKVALCGWAGALLLWIGVRRLPDNARALATRVAVLIALVLAGVIIGGAAVTGRLGGTWPLRNPNDAAAALVPVLALVPLATPSGRLRAAAAAVLVAAAILLTSRAAALALVLVALTSLPPGRRRGWAVVAAVIALVAVLWWRLGVHEDPLAWHRTEIWRSLAAVALESPVIGHGPGLIEELGGRARIAHPEAPVALHGRVIASAESTVMAALLATGAVGLLLLGAAAVAWLRRSGSAHAPGPARAAAAAILAFALFHDYSEMAAVLWWWALVLGLAEGPQGTDGLQANDLLRRRAPLALAAALLLAWGLAQPAAARWIWTGAGDAPGQRDAVLRLEPWYAAPAQWEVDRRLSRAAWRWEEAAAALHWSEEAVRRRPGDHALWRRRGLACSRTAQELGGGAGALACAREAFARATELEPRLPWAWWSWAALERGVGEIGEARRLAAQSTAVEPRFVRGWLLLARLELDAGRPAAAQAALGQARTAIAETAGAARTEYERELVIAPQWQLRQLEEALE